MNVTVVMREFLNAIKGLGEAEVQSMIDEDHGAEAVCHFCEINTNILKVN